MDIEEIEKLVSLAKDAKISELTVTTGTSNPAKVTIRKSLSVKTASSRKGAPKSGSVHASSTTPTVKNAASEGYITALMVGIYHSIESVSHTGAVVKAGQVMGSIESMKLMNDVVSNHSGVIAEVLVDDGMPVEYGQLLFRLDPL
ncbi:MAG: acetyl-CoA carboxylase biotin carboxyl carrier protein [Armatimonadota bacterium]